MTIYRLKCNREKPCNNCRRREHVECEYAAPQPAQKRKKKSSDRAAMRERIRQLEGFIRTMMKGEPIQDSSISEGSSALSRDEDDAIREQLSNKDGAKLLRPNGHISVTGTETKYIGAGHWASILEQIVEVKNFFDTEEEERDIAPASSSVSRGSPLLLIDPSRMSSRSEILSHLPAKPVCDQLLAHCLSSPQSPTCTV